MDPPFRSIHADAPVEEAFEALISGDSAVLVFDGEAPVGMVTRADLLEFVAHHRG
jgi:predicted transcriptional regulator